MRKILSAIYLLSFIILSSNLSAQVTFTAESQNVNCDEANFCLDITVTNFDSVTGFQFVYDWDTTIMQFTSFTDLMPTGIGTDPNGVPDSTMVGRAPYSWIDLNFPQVGISLADGTAVAQLCFTPNNLGSGNLSFEGSPTTIIEVNGVMNGAVQVVPSAFNAGTITIQDIEDPVIICPSDTIIESNGSTVGDIAPISFTDNCTLTGVSYNMTMGGGNVGSGNDDASGEFFNLGTTTVTYTATDEAGNNGTCSFDVTLNPPPPDTGSLQFIPEVNFDCDAGTVSIDMLVVNFDSISGMQFGMEWDTSIVTYTGNGNNLPPAATYNQVSDSTLLFLWFPFSGAPLTLNDSTAIFTLNFDLNGNFESPILSFISFTGINIGVGQVQNGIDIPLVLGSGFMFMPEIINVVDNMDPMITNCPTDINVNSDPGNCSANVTWTAPTITDNCGIDTIIVSDMPGVFPVGIDTVSYIVIDIGGNRDTCSFTITVTDNEDPVITCPGSVTVDATFGTCSNNSVNIGMATATDNCGVATVTSNAPASFPVGTTIITWTATDVNGNTSTCTQNITIEDNELPTITCPADIAVCPGTPIILGTPTTADNCGILTVNNDAPANYAIGLNVVTWTVTDLNGNMNTCIQNVTIEDNELPTISCPADIVACPGAAINLGTPTTADNCGVSTVTNDAPANYVIGLNVVTWTVTDLNGNMNTCIQNVTIEDNELPTISCPADIVACPGAAINLGTPTTADNCGVSTVTNDAPANYVIGLNVVTWTVTDLNGNIATCMQRVIILDDEVPMITCPGTDAIDAPLGSCSAVYSNNLSPIVSDNCDTDLTVTYTITGATPTTMGIDDATGETFSVGSSTLTYYVEDDNGNIDSCSVTILVNDNELPVLTCPNDSTIFVPAGIVDTMINSLTLSTSDNCGIASTTFGFTGQLTGMGIGDDASGTSFPSGATTVTYYVTDLNGNQDSCSFTINIQPTSSDLIGCQPDQVESNDPGLCSAVINGIAPTLLVPSSSIANITYSLNGVTTGTDDASGTAFNVGTTTLQYIATDNFGNMDSCSLQITVNDTELPVWSNCPTDVSQTVNIMDACTAQVSWTPPTPNDNCGIQQIIISHMPGDTFPVGTTPVSYVAFDAAGNVGTCTFNVIVTDNTPPTANCPADITVNASPGNCDAIVNWAPINGTDACSAVTVSCTSMSGDSFPVGTSTVVCTFSDGNGNTSNCSFDITVIDNSAPIPQNCPADITVDPTLDDCEAIVNWTAPTFLDCPPINITSTHEPGDTFPLGTTTVIYIAIDPAGNDTTCSFNINVIDSEMPIVNCPVDITVNSLNKDCGAFVNWTAPTATDNCDDNVAITQVPTPGTFFPVGTNTITVTATDNAGNVGTCTFDVIVNDVIAPVFDCPTETIVISVDGTIISGGNGLILNTTANGNCDSLIIDYADPAVTDNCGIETLSVDTMNNILSGGTFPIGTSTIDYIAFDGSNNFATCSFNIEVVALEPVGVAILADNEVCEGETVQLVTDVSAPGAIFSWSGPNFTSNDPNPGVGPVTIGDAGTYSVTVTFTSGCTAVGSDILIVNPAEAVIASSNSPICTGEDIMLDVQIPVGSNPTFAWTGPDNFTSALQNPTIVNPTIANSGTYNVTVTYTGGCFTSSSTTVTITSLTAPEIDLDCETDICLGSSCVLTGTEYSPTPEFYNWSATPVAGSGLPNDTQDNQIFITPTLPGTYIYTYSVELNGCESEEVSQVVIVNGAPDAIEDSFDIIYETEQDIFVTENDDFNLNIGVNVSIVSSTMNGTLVNNNNGTFTYTPNPGFIGTDQFIYEICNDCGPLLCDNTIVTLTVSDDRDCVFPTVITPNKDGKNDELFINCLEGGDFPNNEIIIYNQWGDEVFTAAPYQNNWEGTFNGEDLPDGTYYVVFRLDNNAEIIKQFITIFR